MGGWLAASQLAVRKITLSLEHERGRRARPPTELELALSQPAWQPAQILGLLREKLGRMTLTDPVIAVALLAPRPWPSPPPAPRFPGSTAEDQTRLLDLLSARWAAGACAAPGPRPIRPEAANAWGDALQAPAGAEPLPALLDRPFWLLDPPQPLRLAGDRPQYRGQALRLMRGPERIESGWWIRS